MQYTHIEDWSDGSVYESTHLRPANMSPELTLDSPLLSDDEDDWDAKDLGPLHNTKGPAVTHKLTDGSVDHKYFIYGEELPYEVWLLAAPAYDALIIEGAHPSEENREKLIESARNRVGGQSQGRDGIGD